MFARSRFNLERNLSAEYQWEFGTGCFPLKSLFQSLVTFSLFAVISVLFQLLCHSSLLLMLPFLCVFRVGGRRVWPQSDDDTSHVVTAGPISRSVRGQTVVQQLSRHHVEFQKDAKGLQKTTNVGKKSKPSVLVWRIWLASEKGLYLIKQ